MFPASRDKNGPAVRRVIDSGQRSLIHRRDVRGVLREVFATSDGFVLKRYTHRKSPPRFRRPWVLEYRALDRLDGSGAPRVLGYLTEHTGQGFRATLVRRFVPGEPIGNIDMGLAIEIAGLLVHIHVEGVTTDDAHRHNFIRVADGGLAFLDFGRARTFPPWSPLLPAAIAVDLHRFFRAGLKRNRELWQVFLDEYFRRCPFGAVRQRLIRRLIAFDVWRYGWVKGKRSG
jgi:hypothetical protein